MHGIPPKDIPAIDAPDSAYTIADAEQRASCVAWACAVVADIPHYSDEALTRASRILLHNSPEMRRTAEALLDVLERCNAA